MTAVDPRAEAFERLDGRYDARVLEPSPPAVTTPPWFADDPVGRDAASTGRRVVAPVTTGELTWDELARDDADLAVWCADRWLGAWRPLRPLPARDALARTRIAWHSLAEHVVAPARHRATGKIGLRHTRGGFGTPYFGSPTGDGDEQIRVAGTELVIIRRGAATVLPITTPRAAARAVGGSLGATDVYEPQTALAPDRTLPVDGAAGQALGEWYGFACSVLEQLRAEIPGDVSRVQLWPEHFDLAFDAGDETAGARGTFGASPGDDEHDDPYLYVTHWAPLAPDGYWSDAAFDGASLAFADLLSAGDQRELALDFFRRGQRLLTRG